MKAELEIKLINDNKELFTSLYKSKKGDVITPIQFGLECGDGWHIILHALFANISGHIASKKKYPTKVVKPEIARKFFNRVNRMPYKYNKFFSKFRRRFEHMVATEIDVDITQVKEKYGTLRIYYNGGDDEIGGMIDMAEMMSIYTCELCGSTENVGITLGWNTTCCKKCFDAGKTNMKKWVPSIDEVENVEISATIGCAGGNCKK